uniref:Uncharacterized protein n=1 Tax=Ditylum brightwellii TaxID=49249 RepID=A0A7S1YS47_9STRA|mmetsp:Transcript_15809/g.23486  ORF Transcript_15809/g.23486 Transcript_15809/m.23486 type:complete len:129 (+) Transcript_15809:220-606(+)
MQLFLPSIDCSLLLGLSSPISQHIGELPSKDKMMRCPLDRLRCDDDDDNNNSNNDSIHSKECTNSNESIHSEYAASKESKSSLCIGFIFGMGMGGTLAKLVYFEQESRELSLQQHEEQIEHYYQALST